MVENTEPGIFQSESKVAPILFPDVEETVDSVGGDLENRMELRSLA